MREHFNEFSRKASCPSNWIWTFLLLLIVRWYIRNFYGNLFLHKEQQYWIRQRKVTRVYFISNIFVSIEEKNNWQCAVITKPIHIKWCSCRLTVTWRTSTVEQQTTNPFRSIIVHFLFSGVHGAKSLVFCVFCRLLFVLLVILRFKASDDPLGIFKLFMS
jgi:hypothetical protein